MPRHRSRLPLILVLALALGALWQRRDLFTNPSNPEDASENGGNPENLPQAYGLIPLTSTFDAIPADPPRQNTQAASPEMRTLAARMSRETKDLKVITHPDRRRSVSLEGRFLHMSAMVTGADGKPQVRCFTDFQEMEAALQGGQSVDPPRPVIHVR